MVRLKDIAAASGVSVMTVSKALRDARDISIATKGRIRRLAEEMGYVPDTTAQGLRNRVTKLFGVVLPAMTHPVSARILMAIEEQSHELGYNVVLAHTLNLPDREEQVIRRLLARRVDGLFISPVYRLGSNAPIYDELRRRGIPTVILGHNAPFCRDFVNVETDDLLGSFSMTRHLLGLGHRKIAFLGGPPASPWAQERFEGYRRALREAELDVDDQLVFAAGATIEEGAKAALQILHESPHVTAIQAVNDLVAIGAATTFLNQGVRIPRDLSVAGYGNILTSEHYRVPLTTVRQPKYRLGAAAMEAMLRLLRNERSAPRRLPTEIVVRASTGPPRPVSPPGVSPP
jgi:DNA-binding LacI/PurR family transcriptional regulator